MALLLKHQPTFKSQYAGKVKIVVGSNIYGVKLTSKAIEWRSDISEASDKIHALMFEKSIDITADKTYSAVIIFKAGTSIFCQGGGWKNNNQQIKFEFSNCEGADNGPGKFWEIYYTY